MFDAVARRRQFALPIVSQGFGTSRWQLKVECYIAYRGCEREC
jgi:hypothetical protein